MAGKAVIGRAVLELSTDGKDLSEGLDKAEQKTKGWGENVGKIGIAAVAGLATVGAAIIGTSIKAAMDAEKISAQTAAVITSTGGAAGMTKQAVEALALELSKVIPIEDDLIQETQNMLLTFTKIGKEVFPLATETALNMATALGGSPVDASIQLGKALNDPIAGISALSRVGVTFSEDQKKAIKALMDTGDVAGAQKIILAELATEFGNSGRAAGETMAGKLTIAQNALGNIQEEIGGALLPVLAELLTALMPIIEAFAAWIPEALAATKLWFKENETTIREVMTVVGNLAGIVLPLLGASIGRSVEAVKIVIQTFQNMISTVQNAIGWVQNLASAIRNMPGVQGIAGAIGGLRLPGFAQGGVVPGPIGAPQLAVVHGGETVVPVGGDAGRPIVITLDGQVLAKAMGDRQQQRSFLAGAAIG